MRPPWAVADFLELCTRCRSCIDHCPQKILVVGDGGYPQVDFSIDGCDWCQACVDSCELDALDTELGLVWPWRAELKQHRCLSEKGIVCRTCGDSCEQRAINFQLQLGGRATPEIDEELCNGCGFCVAVCPEKAIQMGEAK